MLQTLEAQGSPSARNCLVEWLATIKIESDPRLQKTLLESMVRFDRKHPELKTVDVAKTPDLKTSPPSAARSTSPQSPAGLGARSSGTSHANQPLADATSHGAQP
jgi:hypothetical protein